MSVIQCPGSNVVRLFERRGQPRLRVLLSGKLAFPDNAIAAECLIRNLSETGAMVVSDDLALPRDPFLVVVKHAFLHQAQTAWRQGPVSGLSFSSSWRLLEDRKGVAPLRSLWLELLPA